MFDVLFYLAREIISLSKKIFPQVALSLLREEQEYCLLSKTLHSKCRVEGKYLNISIINIAFIC